MIFSRLLFIIEKELLLLKEFSEKSPHMVVGFEIRAMHVSIVLIVISS